MKRRLLQIIVLLLLGAIVNVAVALTVSYLTIDLLPTSRKTAMPTDIEREWWQQHAHDEVKEIHLFSATYTGCLGYRKYELYGERVDQHGEPFHDWNQMLSASRYTVHAGFPFPTLHGEAWFWRHGRTRMFAWVPKSRVFMVREFEFLPLVFLWPGFAINTIFYAAILWVVFFVPGRVKRRVRRRRGLCPACAFPVGTSPVCTECGKAVDNEIVRKQP